MSAPTGPFRCADAARGRADPLAGSAPPARRWLLLEHPGPWRTDAVAGAGLEPSVLALLTARAAQAGARMMLIRRPGRMTRGAPRRWILAGLDAATVSGRWTEDADLLVAADALLAPAVRRVEPADPLILVCTHGVHDTCCAIRGRPVAAALALRWPDQVWECSHVGGDRFAPNVVVLPDGFFYGNLDPESATETVHRHLSGAVDTGHLRGMARFAPPVQAAVVAAFEQCGPLGPDEVRVRSVDQVGPHHGHGSETFVELEIGEPARLARVQMLSVRRPNALLTCGARRATPATEYQVRGFDLRPESPGA